MTSFCIVGSGPAAVSAAVALTRLGVDVTMLDAGHHLESPRRQIVTRMSAQDPEEWSAADLVAVREGVEASASGIPLKRLYGSDFPFRTAGTGIELREKNTGIRPGFSHGGFSNVWGAGILPWHPDDLTDWPAGTADLGEYYRQVFSFLPCAAVVDDLAELFPVYAAQYGELSPGRQADAFLRDAAASRERLRSRGIFVGRSRLAVDCAGSLHGTRACERCGLCLYGCPYSLIYNAAFTIRRLLDLPNFRLESGFVVDELREEERGVAVLGHGRENGEPRRLDASRVLLGAGALASSAILLRSMGEFDQQIRLADSHYFLLPLLRLKGSPGVTAERLHTLAQAFIVLRDRALCGSLVHLSVYTFNDLTLPSLKAAAGFAGALPGGGPFWRAMAERLLPCGGYLHSDLSPGIRMSLEKAPAGGITIHLEGEDGSAAGQLIRRIGMKLLGESAALKAAPLAPLVRRAPPGRGFHSGSAFPMRAVRGPHTSDVEGRPFGFDRVHLIDASCLPSIPATTMTLPVMASAYRIATLAARRDG